MGVTNSNKVADTAAICCGDSFKVTLALTAAPDIVTNPTDIVLVLDRSGSLSGPPFADMKAGAKTFIDIISESTGGSGSGEIGSGSRMAVVSFASTASADAPLTTSVADLKAAVDALSAGGGTNHGDAFQKAQALFDPASANARTIVMFTDGVTTSGPAPGPIAAAARAAGTVIYCIGLIGSDGLDIAALNNWATDPDASHVAVTPDAAELEDLFAELAANISKPGATDVLILETLDADFELGEVEPPDKGSVIVTGPRSLRWSIDSLGTTKSESAALRFAVRHTGDATGSLHVNESIEYSDAEGNLVRFPDPEVYVDCGSDVYPEPCPEPRELILPSCTDSAEFVTGDINRDGCDELLNLRAANSTTYLVDQYTFPLGQEPQATSAALSAGISALQRLRMVTLAGDAPALLAESTLTTGDLVSDLFVCRDGSLINLTMNRTTQISETRRSYSLVYAQDIDGDGSTEIPHPQQLYSRGDEVFWSIAWFRYDASGRASTIMTTYHCVTDNWYLVLPSGWDVGLTVRRDDSVSGERAVILSRLRSDGSLEDYVAVYAITGENRYERARLDNRFLLQEEGTTVYAAKLLDGKTDENTIRSRFHVIYTDWSSGSVVGG